MSHSIKSMTPSIRSIRGTIIPTALIASAIIGLLTVTGLYMLPLTSAVTEMTINPMTKSVVPGESFTVAIIVSAATPVNAFAGLISFDESILDVDAIDYNTSIADLWAKEPWFSRGNGTITFAGGSTEPGGFTQIGTLLTITFKAKQPGDAKITMRDIKILKHDGLGSTANERVSLDTVFNVVPETIQTTSPQSDITTSIAVVTTKHGTDLNNDQKTNLRDVSIFMMYLVTGDLRADFNDDKLVNTIDLSLLLAARD